MKNKKYHSLGTIPILNIKTHKYMTVHFPGLLLVLQ